MSYRVGPGPWRDGSVSYRLRRGRFGGVPASYGGEGALSLEGMLPSWGGKPLLSGENGDRSCGGGTETVRSPESPNRRAMR